MVHKRHGKNRHQAVRRYQTDHRRYAAHLHKPVKRDATVTQALNNAAE